MFAVLDLIIFTQIFFETVPVSSGAHVFLVKTILKQYFPHLVSYIPNQTICELLNVPTIFVTAIFFRKEILSLLSTQTTAFITLKARRCLAIDIISKGVLAAFITYVVYNGAENIKFWSKPLSIQSTVVFVGLCLSMVLLISLKWLPQKSSITYSSLTWKKTILIGIAQSISIVPGISRLGITYATSRWLNIAPATALKFSFLLHAILSVGVVVKSITLSGSFMCMIQPFFTQTSAIVLIIASIASYAGLSLSWNLATKTRFWYFGFYYVIPITILFILFLK